MWMKKKRLNYIYIYMNNLNNKIYKPLEWSGSRFKKDGTRLAKPILA